MNILMFGPNGSGKGTQALSSRRRLVWPISNPEPFSANMWAAEPNSAKRPRNIWIAANSSLTPSLFPWSSKP